MGVYIKGMEMPTSCAFCKLKRRNGKKMICPLLNEEWDIRDPMSADFKLDNCPLVEIPPHGRLVDMGEIEERIDSCCDDIDCSKTMCNECAVQIVMNKVFDAPTIIPAEEGE